MYYFLVSIIVGLVIASLFVNVYFRVKVMKAYKKLVQANVDFGTVHIFNKKRLEKEVLPRYPKSKEDILTFVNHIQYSIKMGTFIVFLITAFGMVLMYYRFDY